MLRRPISLAGMRHPPAETKKKKNAPNPESSQKKEAPRLILRTVLSHPLLRHLLPLHLLRAHRLVALEDCRVTALRVWVNHLHVTAAAAAAVAWSRTKRKAIVQAGRSTTAPARNTTCVIGVTCGLSKIYGIATPCSDNQKGTERGGPGMGNKAGGTWTRQEQEAEEMGTTRTPCPLTPEALWRVVRRAQHSGSSSGWHVGVPRQQGQTHSRSV